MPIHHTLCSRVHLRPLRFASACAAAALLATSALAGDLTKDLSKSIVETPPSRFHALLNLEFSNKYITPRGLDTENQGLVFQPLFLTFTTLYHSKEGFVQDVGLTAGVWNSIHERRSGARPGNLNETDPIAGLTFKLAGNFEFDATYSAFFSQTHSYETCHNLSLKLTYNDKWFGDSFSINPFVEYWQELHHKASVEFNPVTASYDFYFAIGVNPTYKFKNFPLELSLPTSFNIVDTNFYQKFDGTGGGAGVAVVTTELKASVPLKFVPPSLGHWSVYAGYQYYHLNNAGLLDTNQVLGATSERLHNLWQVHGGISIFF